MTQPIDRCRTRAGDPRPQLIGLGLGASSAAVSWWLTAGDATDRTDHLVGPFRVPLALESVVAVLALLAGAASLAWLVRAVRAGRPPGLRTGAVVAAMAAGAWLAACWRTMTAGVVGANIGGGLVVLVGPAGFAGLVLAAVATGTPGRQEDGRARRRAIAGSGFLMVALYAAEWLLLR